MSKTGIFQDAHAAEHDMYNTTVPTRYGRLGLTSCYTLAMTVATLKMLNDSSSRSKAFTRRRQVLPSQVVSMACRFSLLDPTSLFSFECEWGRSLPQRFP